MKHLDGVSVVETSDIYFLYRAFSALCKTLKKAPERQYVSKVALSY